MIVTIGKIASADGQSAVLWPVVSILFVVVCIMFIPMAFLRVLIAGILTFVALTVYKMVKK